MTRPSNGARRTSRGASCPEGACPFDSTEARRRGDLLVADAVEVQRPLGRLRRRLLGEVVPLPRLELPGADGLRLDQRLRALVGARRDAQARQLPQQLLAGAAQLHALDLEDRVALAHAGAQVDADRRRPALHVRGELEQAVLVVVHAAGEDEHVLEVHRLDLPGRDPRLGDGGRGEAHALREGLVTGGRLGGRLRGLGRGLGLGRRRLAARGPGRAGRQEEQQGSNALRGHVSYLQGSKSGPASRCTSATAKAWARCDSRRSRCASRKVRCASRRSRSEVSPSS